jgi:hypothetical protein
MNTHLSEASVNSLLTLVKGANTSRSYDDKINILTKAGILQGGQKYSSRATVTEVLDPVDALSWGLGDAVTLAGATADAANPWNQVRVGAAVAYANVNNFAKIATAARLASGEATGVYEAVLNAIAAGKSSIDVSPAVFAAFAGAVRDLDFAAGGTLYTDFFAQVKSRGLVMDLARLKKYQSDALADPTILAEIVALLLLLLELGLLIDEIIKESSAYLSTIPDGKYNFTVFPANTAQPVILTGTAVITSQYDQYSSILLQKLINNTIVGTPPITALQTLDISYNSRQIDTSGSSSTGKYTVAGNTATITSNGYSQTAGAFVDTETIIITFPAVFYVINNIINQDKSKTTISLTYYTRQLTSGELDGLVNALIAAADKNGDGSISQAELGAVFAALIAQIFVLFDTNGDGVISGPEAKQAIQTLLDLIYSLLQSLLSMPPPQPN